MPPLSARPQEEIESCERLIRERAAQLPPDADRPGLAVLPIYAALPPEQQLRVFQPSPEGTRKVGGRCWAVDGGARALCLAGVGSSQWRASAHCRRRRRSQRSHQGLLRLLGLVGTVRRSSWPPTLPRRPSPSAACAT